MRQWQNTKKGVTPAKAGAQKFLKRLDSRFRGNDNLGLLQLAQVIKINPFKLIISPARIGWKHPPY
jgi:hypothetical protein